MLIAIPFILNSLFNFAIGLLVAKFLGPAEYGRFALALSTAIVIETLCFDWLRLSATRYYSEQDRTSRPEIRATLNLMFAVIAVIVLAAAGMLAFAQISLPLSKGLVLLTIGAALTNSMFDFSASLERARFLDRAYGVLVIAKNVTSIALTVGGAWYFGSAKAALAGMMISVIGSLAISRRTLHDAAATPRRAERRLALSFAAYALPIVLANGLYQTVPMINRGLVAHIHSFAESGQLALAFETGIRIIGAIGTSIDVLLFQLAVRAEKRFGASAARERVAGNMGVVFAVVLAVVCGCWLILPSFERIFIPEHFRGPFAHYFTLTLPAVMAFALINYGVGPAFQIAHRTLPLIVCALIGVVSDGVAIVFLPVSSDATSFALAQSISTCAALAAMIVLMAKLAPVWPRARDIFGALAAAAAMTAAVLPLRHLPPSLATLASQVGAGVAVYGLVVLIADVAQIRSLLAPRLLGGLGRKQAAADLTTRSEQAAVEAQIIELDRTAIG